MEFKCLIVVLFFIYDAYTLLIGLVWTYTLLVIMLLMKLDSLKC
jgi:hypothetical protein